MVLKYDFDGYDYEYEVDVDKQELKELIGWYTDVDEINDDTRKLLDFILNDLDIKDQLEEFFEDQIKDNHYDEAAADCAEQRDLAEAEADNIAEIMRSWH